jgi:hypothetical protein
MKIDDDDAADARDALHLGELVLSVPQRAFRRR